MGQRITFARTASRGSAYYVRVDGEPAGLVKRTGREWVAAGMRPSDERRSRTGFASKEEAGEWLGRFFIPGIDPSEID